MYIARDKNGSLFIFEEKPYKSVIEWVNSNMNDCEIMEISASLFPEVKWEDEEPTEIKLVKKEK